jgi:hypothetical protein
VGDRFYSYIAKAKRIRMGCRGRTPAWGRSPHPPVLTDLSMAITATLVNKPEVKILRTVLLTRLIDSRMNV